MTDFLCFFWFLLVTLLIFFIWNSQQVTRFMKIYLLKVHWSDIPKLRVEPSRDLAMSTSPWMLADTSRSVEPTGAKNELMVEGKDRRTEASAPTAGISVCCSLHVEHIQRSREVTCCHVLLSHLIKGHPKVLLYWLGSLWGRKARHECMESDSAQCIWNTWRMVCSLGWRLSRYSLLVLISDESWFLCSSVALKFSDSLQAIRWLKCMW